MNSRWERPLVPPMFMNNMDSFRAPNESNMGPNGPNMGLNGPFGFRGPHPQGFRDVGPNNPSMQWFDPNNHNMGQYNPNMENRDMEFQPQTGFSESDMTNNKNSGPLIGPKLPEGIQQDNHDVVDITPDDDGDAAIETSTQSKSDESNQRESRSDRRQRDRGADRDNRKRDRSDRYRGDRNDSRGDRNDSRGDRDRHDRGNRHDQGSRNDRVVKRRASKWSDDVGPAPMQMPTAVVMPNQMLHNGMPSGGISQGGIASGGMPPGPMGDGMPSGMQGMGNMIMPSQGMMPYNNMMNNQMIGQQMHPNMPNMPMMQSNNMMMMMNNMMTQPIMLSRGILLPALPNISTPKRREKPLGCRTIFVGGLPVGIVESVVAEIFERFGAIDTIKLHKQAVCHVRFHDRDSVDRAFTLTGYRFKFHNQIDNEATTLFIDYALNRDDQSEHEKRVRDRIPTPPPIEPFSVTNLSMITEKIKSEDKFSEAAPTLVGWLERGEVNRKNASVFYTLIQASNNQTRRLYTEKMQLDDELQAFKSSIRDKHEQIVVQFEQVAKILSAAKHQRVSDHLTKQQRKNIEMWLKMTEEVENLKEEFSANFDDEDYDKPGKNAVSKEMYAELTAQYENLAYELEGYKNEAHLAKDEAERKFEKFKAHFIAQQALQGNQPQQVYPPLPPPPGPPTPNAQSNTIEASSASVQPQEAKIISLISAFLIIHPIGASLENVFAYVHSIMPHATQANVRNILQRYNDVFKCVQQVTGPKWQFVTFDYVRSQN